MQDSTGKGFPIQSYIESSEARLAKGSKLYDRLCRACIDRGKYIANRGIQQRVEWFLVFEDREPWLMESGSVCKSNVRVMTTTYYRRPGASRPHHTLSEELIPYVNPSDNARRDMRLTVPTFGKVYLHVLAWWLFKGKPSWLFEGSWQAFRDSKQHVDHGPQGRPHICDLRILHLRSGSGLGSNPAQGASVRWGVYHPRGGLAALVTPPRIQKRPAGRFAKRALLKRPAACC